LRQLFSKILHRVALPALSKFTELDFRHAALGDCRCKHAIEMVSDHSKTNHKFADIAKKEGLNLPKDIDPEHQAITRKLKDLDGRMFDTEYMKVQVADHQKTAQLLEYEVGSGQNAAVKDFASEALPIVLRHLKMAQGVMAELTGQAADRRHAHATC
jgi:putative membrane protein